MATFVLRRVIAGAVLVLVVATITFSLLSVLSGTVASNILGESASHAQIAAKNTELGLNQPLTVQYADWLRMALTGNLGQSWYSDISVNAAISNTLPITMSIIVVGLLISAILSTILGTLAALSPGWPDRVIQFGSVIAAAIPSFLVALVLAMVIAIKLHWLPATGYVPLTQSPLGWLGSIILPSVSLAAGATAGTTQQFRGSLISVLGLDYMRTLRSRGLSTRNLIFKHALRNAAPAAATTLSLQFIGLVGGAVIIEKVFGLPGIGSLASAAAIQGDAPIVLGVVVAMVIIVVIVNLIMDLVQGWLNPKVRLG